MKQMFLVKETKELIEERFSDYLVENPNLFEEVMKRLMVLRF